MSDLTIYTLIYYQADYFLHLSYAAGNPNIAAESKNASDWFFPLQYKFKAPLIVVSSKLLAY